MVIENPINRRPDIIEKQKAHADALERFQEAAWDLGLTLEGVTYFELPGREGTMAVYGGPCGYIHIKRRKASIDVPRPFFTPCLQPLLRAEICPHCHKAPTEDVT